MQGLVPLSIQCPSGSSIKFEADCNDSVLDIKQVLQDTVEGCMYTCFHFELATSDAGTWEPVSDFSEILELVQHRFPQLGSKEEKSDSLVPESLQLRLVTDLYDERSAKEHLKKFRHLIVSPPVRADSDGWLTHLRQGAEVVAHAKENKSPVDIPEIPLAKPLDQLRLEDIIISKPSVSKEKEKPSSKKKNSEQSAKADECVRKVVYSAYNPPPGPCKLRGDLFYLEITTIENHTVFVTANVQGFFVNSSTQSEFNSAPSGSPCRSHNLVELMKKVSHQFKDRFERLLNRKSTKHPFSAIPSQFPITEWCVPVSKHLADANRAETAGLSLYGLEENAMLRSWNDEYQASLEMPKDNPQEKMLRWRVLHRIYSEFASASLKGAEAVVDGNIVAVNPMEPERSHVWVFNNVFFSQANDGRDMYKEFGGFEVNYKIAGLDLKGVSMFEEAQIDGLYVLLTCLVDYKGKRIICQGLIPGILHGDQVSNLVYGYMDDGVSVDPNPEFMKLLETGSKYLGIATRKAVDISGKTVQIASAVETKGIKGSDHRLYVLDLVRVTPRDANFTDPKLHIAHVLRPELVKYFTHLKATEKVRIAVEEHKAATSPENSGETKESQPQVNEEQIYVDAIAEVKFNLNAFTCFECKEDENLEKDKERIVEVTKMLTESVIPSFVEELKTLTVTPIDSGSLTQMFHARGINMRYLGAVATLLAKAVEDESFRGAKQSLQLLLREMIVRASKHYFNYVLHLPVQYHGEASLLAVLTKLFNSLLGSKAFGAGVSSEQVSAAQKVLLMHKNNEEKSFSTPISSSGSVFLQKRDGSKKKTAKKQLSSSKKPEEMSVKLPDGKRAPFSLLASCNMWQWVSRWISDKFGYSFALDSSKLFSVHDRLSMLREVCRKVGIQVQCRSFDFTLEDPLTSDDILQVYPLLKVNIPLGPEASELLYAGRLQMSKGNLQVAFELLMEALHMLHQIAGPMYAETALCYSSLAMVCYYNGEYMQALEHQHRALVISEAVHGRDHSETAHNHGIFALFLHVNGFGTAALEHIIKNYRLMELLCGSSHPETASALFNMGIVLWDLNHASQALEALLAALARFESSLGRKHVQTASCYHAVAVAENTLASFRAAVGHEKQAREIYSSIFGASHAKVVESTEWLGLFTRNAVSFESGQHQKVIASEAAEWTSHVSWIISGFHPRIQMRNRVTIGDVLRYIETHGDSALGELLKKKVDKKKSKKTNN